MTLNYIMTLRTILASLALIFFANAANANILEDKYAVSIPTDYGTLMILPLSDNAVRVKFVKDGTYPLDELIYTEDVAAPKWKTKFTNGIPKVTLKEMSVSYNKATNQLTFYDKKGNIVLMEEPNGKSVKENDVKGTKMLDVSQSFYSPKDEYLFGTGQFQDGYLNIRGLSRRLTQVNTQISIPFVLSSKGYGLLWNNYGLTEFNPTGNSIKLAPSNQKGEVMQVNATSTTGNVNERRISDTFTGKINIEEDGEYSILLDVGQSMSRRQYIAIDGKVLVEQNNTWLPPTTSVIAKLTKGEHSVLVKGVRGDLPTFYWNKVEDKTTFHSPVAQALDYTVFVGNADKVISTYRNLTGKAPLMPDYMLGYVHCRERYNTQDEVVNTARMFKEKNIPISVIVQDWQWWGKYGWNAMQFDEDRYPDPKKMVDDLHSMDVKLMISVWSKIAKSSDVGKHFDARNFFIPGTEWIDFFKPEAQEYYKTTFREKMMRPYHIDAWWLDATEPENDDISGRPIGNEQISGDIYRNVYPLKVVNSAYDGMTAEEPDKVPVILTRSAFSGIQRYNAVTWSGDVNSDLETLRRQIVGGLGYMTTGLPWWTYDAGGFFRPGDQYTNKQYQESMLRWIECSVFLPIMRVHGYQSNTEPWNYPEETEKIFVNCIKQRYELLPYIKECARKVSEENYTMMRPLIFDFPDDEEALKQEVEYMFGPSYLVCPIIEYGVTEWEVYLPNNKKGWNDFYTKEHYKGGQHIKVKATLDKIPVFVRK